MHDGVADRADVMFVKNAMHNQEFEEEENLMPDLHTAEHAPIAHPEIYERVPRKIVESGGWYSDVID